MIAWIIVTLLTASVCGAAIGLAWLVGLRRGWVLLLVGTTAGALSGLLVTLVPGTASQQLFAAAFGAAVGSAVWLVGWQNIRGPHGM